MYINGGCGRKRELAARQYEKGKERERDGLKEGSWLAGKKQGFHYISLYRLSSLLLTHSLTHWPTSFLPSFLPSFLLVLDEQAKQPCTDTALIKSGEEERRVSE